MLLNIPKIISPRVMKYLMKMGHLEIEHYTVIRNKFKKIIANHINSFLAFDYLDCYDKSLSADVIVQTSTSIRYANIMLQKGVI